MYYLKPAFYDSFKCIADKCPYTCCADFQIPLDEETCMKYINKGIEFNTDLEKDIFTMPMNDKDQCIMLECGLCKLVKKYGDDMLSYTCRTYPRYAIIMENADGETVKELYMSNSCPAVLQLLKDLDEPLFFVMDDCTVESLYDVSGNEKRRNDRNMIIDLLQIMDMPLWARCYIAYHYACKIEEAADEDEKNRIRNMYQSEDYLSELYKGLNNIKIPYSDKLEYVKIFFEIMNGSSSTFYKSVSDFINKLDMEAFMEYYDFLEKLMPDYDLFFQNYSVNMMFFNCVREVDGKSLKKDVILLILEISLIFFHVFTLWKKNEGKISWEEIQYVTCHYARMDHNLSMRYELIDNLTKNDLIDEGILLLLLK